MTERMPKLVKDVGQELKSRQSTEVLKPIRYPLCRCSPGECFLHPTLTTCGLRGSGK